MEIRDNLNECVFFVLELKSYLAMDEVIDCESTGSCGDDQGGQC